MDYVPFNQEEYHRWVNDRGDATLRLTYPTLTSNSVIIDAGGYTGNWSESMFIGYECNIYVLEPLKSYYNGIVAKFKAFAENHKVVVVNAALTAKTELAQIAVGGDSSSIYGVSENKETIQCIDVVDFFQKYKIESVSLIKINIEGSEYDLLERIIELGLHKKIDNFQIQFHRFVEHCDTRRKKIQDSLSKTHRCTWNYDWIWENWEIK